MNEILFKAYFKTMRHASFKNEKKIMRSGSRSWIGSSNRASESEKWIMRYLSIEKIKQKIDAPIECDIHAKFIFYFPKSVYYTKKNVRSKTLPDIDNLPPIIFDCLQETGIILNDTFVCSIDGTRRMPIEGNEYFVSIELFKFVDTSLGLI